MTQELELRKEQRPVLMKSGLVHWVTLHTAANIQQVLEKQEGHTFINIRELGISLNTAQVEGVYTLTQYEDMMKIKQGQWECEYKIWHGRREECQCKKNAWQTHERNMQRAHEAKERAEPTPEQRAAGLAAMKSAGEYLRSKGALGPSKEQIGANGRTCSKCPTKLTGRLQYYCSGPCVMKARADGTYGREEELKEAANTI